MTGPALGRREAMVRFASLLAASPALLAQRPSASGGEAPSRITPLDEFANAPDFEAMARRNLGAATFARIAGGERSALDRITFRPRMMVNTKALDLSMQLLGQEMFAPILVGPSSRQNLLHPGGEAETARGAAASQAVLVTAERSGTPLAESVAATPGAWRQMYPSENLTELIEHVQEAAEAGCHAACLTLASGLSAARYGWDAIGRVREAAKIPLVIKGIMQPADAAKAADLGTAAIIVSNHGSGLAAGAGEPVSALPAIAEAVAGRVPVLVDGGFRRGGDVFKALALGAAAVLVCRPALWGLAAYGAAGVQKVVEMLQTELAQDMVQIGAVSIAAIRRDHIRVHSR